MAVYDRQAALNLLLTTCVHEKPALQTFNFQSA